MRCELLSKRTFWGRKYSRADCSAVRIAVRKALFGVKIQQNRLHCSADCCQIIHPDKPLTLFPRRTFLLYLRRPAFAPVQRIFRNEHIV